MEMLLLFVGFIALMYFLMIRPNQKRMREHQKTLDALREGARVQLTSGIFATIRHVGDQQLIVELAPGVEVTVLKAAISRPVAPEDEEFEFADEEALDSAADDVISQAEAIAASDAAADEAEVDTVSIELSDDADEDSATAEDGADEDADADSVSDEADETDTPKDR